MKLLPQALVLAGLAVAGLTVAQAQDGQAAAAPAQAGQRSDGQIEMDVVHALDGSKALKNDMITAATIQGEVSLSGTVSTEASSELAEAIAGHVVGVSKVNNNLKVGDPQAAQADPNAQAAG
jgi:osmotically-inducible protein OsmY